jgi:hypothetical protein
LRALTQEGRRKKAEVQMNRHIVRYLAVLALSAAQISIAHADAPSGRYTAEDGTVYDNRTKLTWQQSVSSTLYSQQGARSYCVSLGVASGQTDWRLPTLKELLTIVDHSQVNPAIDPTTFPLTPLDAFWTLTSQARASTSAWLVNFDVGRTITDSVANKYSVRCVR